MIAILKKIPWHVWAGIALLIAIGVFRQHWINVGEARCEKHHKDAEDAALLSAHQQEIIAPALIQAASESVKPHIEERIRIIRENITVTSCPAYPDSVQAVVREAASAAD